MLQLQKYLVILSSLLLINGCSLLAPTKEVVVKTEYVQKTVPLQARPKPLKLDNIQWSVVTQDNIDSYLNQFTDTSIVFFALSVSDYETLALNMSEIRRYIEQQKAIIVYYETSLSNTQEDLNETK